MADNVADRVNQPKADSKTLLKIHSSQLIGFLRYFIENLELIIPRI